MPQLSPVQPEEPQQHDHLDRCFYITKKIQKSSFIPPKEIKSQAFLSRLRPSDPKSTLVLHDRGQIDDTKKTEDPSPEKPSRWTDPHRRPQESYPFGLVKPEERDDQGTRGGNNPLLEGQLGS